MNYKPYATAAITPSRKARKYARREVFVTNKKMRKAFKKQKRLASRVVA